MQSLITDLTKKNKEQKQENKDKIHQFIQTHIAKSQTEVIGGELIDSHGNIFEFTKNSNNQFVLTNENKIAKFELNPSTKIKTIPISQKYDNKPTTDMILFFEDENGERNFVFINREFPPSGLAFPGGQVEDNETANINALKELEEEIGFQTSFDDLTYLGIFNGKEIRGTLKTSMYLIDLKKIYGENFSQVLNSLKAGSDAIGLIVKKESEILSKAPYEHTTQMLVPHHLEMLKVIISLLNAQKNNEKVDLQHSKYKKFDFDSKFISSLHFTKDIPNQSPKIKH